MKKLKQKKAGMFLLEIMLNSFFFVILVTICLQLFFKAHTLSENTTLLHHAVTTCSSVAEIFQSGVDGKESIANIYPHAILLDQSILIFFDSEYEDCSKEEATYRVMLTTQADHQQTTTVTFSNPDGSEIIYAIDISGYRPQTVSTYAGGSAE